MLTLSNVKLFQQDIDWKWWRHLNLLVWTRESLENWNRISLWQISVSGAGHFEEKGGGEREEKSSKINIAKKHDRVVIISCKIQGIL